MVPPLLVVGDSFHPSFHLFKNTTKISKTIPIAIGVVPFVVRVDFISSSPIDCVQDGFGLDVGAATIVRDGNGWYHISKAYQSFQASCPSLSKESHY